MNLPVEESEFIRCDIQDAVRYLRPRNPAAAVRFVEAFKSTVALLEGMPHMGRVRPDLGVHLRRDRGVWGHFGITFSFEILPDRLRLLRVLHGYRDLQAKLQE
jgi:plasmid stabilization system protein ParE